MTLLVSAAATYGLRVVLITLVPAHRLPAVLRRGLTHLAPAALAALVVTALVGHRGRRPWSCPARCTSRSPSPRSSRGGSATPPCPSWPPSR